MNLLLQLYTPSKCQIYNKWTVHEHKCLSSFLFFRFPSNWEREREWYINLGIRRNSPKVTYLIFQWGSTGESFFFYGLIDFMLFLTLAWRKWLLQSEIFFCLLLPGVLALAPSATSPVQQLTFLFSISADGKESPLPFWGPSQSFGFYLPVSGDPSEVTKYKHLVSPVTHIPS